VRTRLVWGKYHCRAAIIKYLNILKIEDIVIKAENFNVYNLYIDLAIQKYSDEIMNLGIGSLYTNNLG